MASAYDSKSIRQKNGEIVMSALRAINEPSTLTNIIKFVSEAQQVEPGQIKEPVKKVLEKGVEYGFLKKQGAKYCVDAPEEEDEEDADVDFDDLEDRGARRRRRSKSRRSRSRSRSKRRGSRKRRR